MMSQLTPVKQNIILLLKARKRIGGKNVTIAILKI